MHGIEYLFFIQKNSCLENGKEELENFKRVVTDSLIYKPQEVTAGVRILKFKA